MFLDRNPLALWHPVAAIAADAGAIRRAAAERRQELLLDEALKETFPASDPVSVVRLT